MDNNSLKELQKITVPRNFSKGDYICYEGQPGTEMYIVLKGMVGIYLNDSMGNIKEVSKVTEGEFFGEMAIFDHLPRSASCIALKDTVCVAINEENIDNLFVCCPQIAKKLVATMSGRIRNLNHEIYKNNRRMKNRKVAKFSIPSAYAFSHVVSEPYQAPQYIDRAIHICPVCKEEVEVVGVRKNKLSQRRIDLDGQMNYYECNPLWYEVIGCPHCNYSNYYLSFFNIDEEEIEQVKQIVEEEHRPVIDTILNSTAFDNVVLRYLQTIHLHEHIHQDDMEMLGTLWLKLYWLVKDSGDQRFTKYCAKNAVKKLRTALDGNLIADADSKCHISLSFSYLLNYLGEKEDALEYCSIAAESSNPKLKEQALRLKNMIEKDRI